MVDFAKALREKKTSVKERKANPCPIIAVVNAKTPISEWPIFSDVYIGRGMARSPLFGSHSPVANPFKMSQTASRAHVVSKYKVWLWKKMQDTESDQYRELLKIMEYSLSLKGVSVVCWCHPKPCHGDVVKSAIEWLWAQGVRPDGWTVEKIR